MRQILVRTVSVAVLIGGATFAYAFSTGPPDSRTGAKAVASRPAEANCTVCHSGSTLNDPSGQLRILDVPATYTPGEQYDLRVQLSHTWNPLPLNPIKWGFQITAVQATTGDSAGLWLLGTNAPPDTFRSRKPSTGSFNRRRYIMHTRSALHPIWPQGSTREGLPSPVEWTLKWQAPPGDSGKVYFFAAGNSANGDGVAISSGDFIFTTAESTTFGSNVDVPPHSPDIDLNFALDAPWPNPMEKCTNIDFTLPRAANVDLSIFDLQGRKIRTLLNGLRSPGTHGWFWDGKKTDGSYADNGVYFLRLRAGGERRVLTQKIALARR